MFIRVWLHAFFTLLLPNRNYFQNNFVWFSVGICLFTIFGYVLALDFDDISRGAAVLLWKNVFWNELVKGFQLVMNV